MTQNPQSSFPSSENLYDVVVIGGGAAGLSAAVCLARSLRSVLVIHDGSPRNAPSSHAHNVLGQEGSSPAEILERGRREAQDYGAQIIEDEVTQLSGSDGNFRVETAGHGTCTARKVVLATGLADELPEVEGLQELWGQQVLHCPYCHGYEVRGQHIAVLGTAPGSVHHALLFRQLSEHVTFLATMEPEPQMQQYLDRAGIACIRSGARSVSGTETGQVEVQLEDGSVMTADALAVAPRFVPRHHLWTGMGGELEESPFGATVPADQDGRTPVPGIWAAGNIQDIKAMVTTAMAQGLSVGVGINMDLVTESLS